MGTIYNLKLSRQKWRKKCQDLRHLVKTQAEEIERLKQENVELRYSLSQAIKEESRVIGWLTYEQKSTLEDDN